jgi:hypothetical protein
MVEEPFHGERGAKALEKVAAEGFRVHGKASAALTVLGEKVEDRKWFLSMAEVAGGARLMVGRERRFAVESGAVIRNWG